MLHQVIFKSDDYDMNIFLHLRKFKLILLPSREKKEYRYITLQMQFCACKQL